MAIEQALTPVAALREVQQRLVRIHYPLAEAPDVDVELQRRTLDRLMSLMEYVNAAIEGAQPESLDTPATKS